MNADKKRDTEQIRSIRDGNESAFEQLFRHYGQALVYFAHNYVRDLSIAENLVQDVFVAVWEKRATLSPDRSIKSYLYTATKNRALKHLRHEEITSKNREKIDLYSVAPSTPDDLLSHDETAAAIGRAIEALPEKCRLVFKLNRFDHLTYAEVAEVLDISVKTVETQMGRALHVLRRTLFEEE